jgi:hypothetical protein
MTILRKAVLADQDPRIVDRVSEFSNNHFREGGLALLGQLFVRQPAIALDLLFRGALDEVVAAIDDSIDLARSSLRFLALVLYQTRHEPRRFDIAIAGGKVAITAILKWSRDKQKGKVVIFEAIRVLRDMDLVANGSSRRLFAEVAPNDRDEVVKVLEGIAAATRPPAPKLALKLFSGKARRVAPESGEWQTLESDS